MSRKSTAIVSCIVLILLLAGCGNGKDYSDRVIGKTFVYEKEGVFGDFKIDIRNDGSFVYYEGMASSYIGVGTWAIEQNTITLTDELFTNIFEIEKGKLIWRAEGSDNFTYVEVKDGEAFNEE